MTRVDVIWLIGYEIRKKNDRLKDPVTYFKYCNLFVSVVYRLNLKL
jgi:hypothetical protein